MYVPNCNLKLCLCWDAGLCLGTNRLRIFTSKQNQILEKMMTRFKHNDKQRENGEGTNPFDDIFSKTSYRIINEY
jgi:hypothetical protein